MRELETEHVRVELHRADQELVVSDRPRQPDEAVLLQLVGERHAHGAHEEASLQLRLPIRGELPAAHLRVADGGESGPDERGAGVLDQVDRLVEPELHVEVRSVRADVHHDREDQLHRPVEEQAVRLAGRVASDLPSRRGDRVSVDPSRGKRGGVDHAPVPGDVVDADGVLGARAVGARVLVLRLTCCLACARARAPRQ